MDIPIHRFNTVVVGSGAAGLNAADCLYEFGQTDIAIVTEGMNMGTSRNTGSDKQTYYKLSFAGDSVMQMARDLFDGGSMHGDIALIEAATSPRSFFKLVELGVPFPHNRYGEYVGYQTDHSSSQRATSAGPLTSKFMTECLQSEVLRKGIKVFDGFQVIAIITNDGSAIGLLTLHQNQFTLFNCTNIVYATGGPAGMYAKSVYPESQTGASGAAFEAGARGINLTESQYGIASIKFRWNLSGTYQQVLPRYISTNQDGTDEREFLDGIPPVSYTANKVGDADIPPLARGARNNKYLSSHLLKGGGAKRRGDSFLNAIFLKGYQWPFDPRKIDGSSRIDLLVYEETQIKNRRVYLDFTRNIGDFSKLNKEAYDYLDKSGALFGTPVERLKKMNRPAYELYLNNGIDLEKEYLEIDVCAQHNNGGLVGNIWWESNIRHLFPVGEVNGTFGVYRPGGSALNSTQTGSLRAAQYICKNYNQEPLSNDEFVSAANDVVAEKINFANKILCDTSNVTELRTVMQTRMTQVGAHIRSLVGVEKAIRECFEDLKNFTEQTKTTDLGEAFRNYDILVTQYVYLHAIRDYIRAGGKSRGSYLIVDGGMEDFSDQVCEIAFDKQTLVCTTEWKPVRPIPQEDNWFENVWNDYREGKIFKC
ncbi:MAG: FAD-binding protein [Oscillospiraceae bacterium]|nr:FAD-binding protein [Oscillospiraceae bacterium]